MSDSAAPKTDPVAEDKCCCCFPLKCGLQALAIISVLGGIDGVKGIMVGLKMASVLWKIAAVVAGLLALASAVLAAMWLIPSCQNKDDNASRKRFTYVFILNLVSYLLQFLVVVIGVKAAAAAAVKTGMA